MPAAHCDTKRIIFQAPDGKTVETISTTPYKYVIAYKEDDGTWRALGFYKARQIVAKRIEQLNRHWDIQGHPLFILAKPVFKYIYQEQ